MRLGFGLKEGGWGVAGFLNGLLGLFGNFVIGWITVSFWRKVLRSGVGTVGGVETHSSPCNLFWLMQVHKKRVRIPIRLFREQYLSLRGTRSHSTCWYVVVLLHFHVKPVCFLVGNYGDALEFSCSRFIICSFCVHLLYRSDSKLLPVDAGTPGYDTV